MNYTDKQLQAIQGAKEVLRQGRGVYRIGGYAGTGKTTIMKEIIDGSNVAVCAFTGKASNVLRNKGVKSAATIHRTLYRYDETNNKYIRIEKLDCIGFAVDEGSMVPVSCWNDLRWHNKPIIVIGDPGQLEPVGEDAKLMHNADIILDQIHRYDKGIAHLATIVRLENRIPKFDNEHVRVQSKSRFMQNILQADVTLCGINKTRIAVNREIRKRRGRVEFLEPGDRLVCLNNDYRIGVFNGMFMTVERVLKKKYDYYDLVLRLEDESVRQLPVWEGCFNLEKTPPKNELPQGLVIADYGECITCHKFQGSEERRVAVIDEQCSLWNPWRWRYTAFTRASEFMDIYYDD